MHEDLARGHLCEYLDSNGMLSPSPTIHVAEKPKSDFGFEVDLVYVIRTNFDNLEQNLIRLFHKIV